MNNHGERNIIIETLSGMCLRGVLFLKCIPKCKYGQIRTCQASHQKRNKHLAHSSQKKEEQC